MNPRSIPSRCCDVIIALFFCFCPLSRLSHSPLLSINMDQAKRLKVEGNKTKQFQLCSSTRETHGFAQSPAHVIWKKSFKRFPEHSFLNARKQTQAWKHLMEQDIPIRAREKHYKWITARVRRKRPRRNDWEAKNRPLLKSRTIVWLPCLSIVRYPAHVTRRLEDEGRRIYIQGRLQGGRGGWGTAAGDVTLARASLAASASAAIARCSCTGSRTSFL